MAKKSKTKARAKGKAKPKQKPKVKAKPKTYGTRVAIYFGKRQLPLLEWARAHAAKRKVSFNRLVMDGLRCIHQLETGDVHYEPTSKVIRAPEPGVAR